MFQPFQFFNLDGATDIGILSPLVSTAAEQDNCLATSLVVHAVTGPVVDPQFTDAGLGRLHITRVAHRQPIYSRLNTSARLPVLEPRNPVVERLRFQEREHGRSVNHGSHTCQPQFTPLSSALWDLRRFRFALHSTPANG